MIQSEERALISQTIIVSCHANWRINLSGRPAQYSSHCFLLSSVSKLGMRFQAIIAEAHQTYSSTQYCTCIVHMLMKRGNCPGGIVRGVIGQGEIGQGEWSLIRVHPSISKLSKVNCTATMVEQSSMLTSRFTMVRQGSTWRVRVHHYDLGCTIIMCRVHQYDQRFYIVS